MSMLTALYNFFIICLLLNFKFAGILYGFELWNLINYILRYFSIFHSKPVNECDLPN